MSVVKPTKLFIEEQEEIPFVIEKILTTSTDQIILVVPENAVLFGSIVSLAIVYRKVGLAGKYLILVTEDVRGLHLAQKAGYIAVQKVSQISNDLWEIAIERQMQLTRVVRDKLRPTEESSSEEITHESDREEDTIVSEKEEANQKEIISEENAEREEFESYKRPKILPKVVEVDGIQVLAGGDIRNLNTSQVHSETILGTLQKSPETPMNTTRSSFAGRDYSRSIPEKKGFAKFISKLSQKKKIPSESKTGGSSLGGDRKFPTKTVLLGVGSFMVIFLLVSYVVVFQLSRVDITIQVKEQELETTEQITGATTITEADTETLQVPIVVSEPEKASAQKNATATGKGLEGEKAKGFINLYNYTDTDISLAAGTRVTSPSAGLSYIITKAVTVTAASADPDPGVDGTGIEVDVPVEAVDIGETYNLSGTSSNTVFVVDGYSGTSQIEGKRFSPFEGGTSEEFLTVSDTDVENLKKQMIPDLEKTVSAQVQNFVPSGFRFIPNTIDFAEPVVTVTPKVGEKVGEDSSFTLSLELSATAFLVKETNLEVIAEFLVLESQESAEAISNLEELNIVEVGSVTEDKVVFTLTSNSTVEETVNINEIREKILGKSISDAKDLLDKEQSIESFNLAFSPFFLPEAVRYVPTVAERVKISVE